MSNFDPNAMLRGAQLTIVGAYRALQNPNLFKHEHYKQALWAVAAGIIINVIVEIPVLLARGSIRTTALFVDLETVTWDEAVMDILNFLQHSVLQLPFFLMNLIKFLDPALDNMFMESLQWVDHTYFLKHRASPPSTLRAPYAAPLSTYTSSLPPISKSLKRTPWTGSSYFLSRYLRKAVFALTGYLLSTAPYIGKFVLPTYSFYVFRGDVGTQASVGVFAVGLVLPRRYLIRFLQTYFSSRSLMRELLEPYFSRLHFPSATKRAWFTSRSGVLFGFGLGFFLLLKIPFLGVLAYGVAEASTAYLLTKITDPPPPGMGEGEQKEWVRGQVEWKTKKEFLRRPWKGLLEGVDVGEEGKEESVTGLRGRKFE